MTAANTAAGIGGSPQQEVVIPDSEESPGGCSQQRQGSHAASPSLNCRPAGVPDNGKEDMADASPVRLQQSSAEQKARQHSSNDQDMSGCSLEALPGHSQPEVCTQSVHAEQHTGQALGCDMRGQVASQRQTCPPKDTCFAGACWQDCTAGGIEITTAAASASGHMIAEPLICDPKAGSEPDQALKHTHQAKSGLQRADPSLPAFSDPIAPAPAGPTEHLRDDQRTPQDMVEAAPRVFDDQQGGVQGPLGVQAKACAVQPVGRGHHLEGSQPSSSSLKRVPETPDSTENRSQPTQSPDGQSAH